MLHSKGRWSMHAAQEGQSFMATCHVDAVTVSYRLPWRHLLSINSEVFFEKAKLFRSNGSGGCMCPSERVH